MDFGVRTKVDHLQNQNEKERSVSYLAWRYNENGYDISQVRSSLQKEVRRGNEERALFWAIQFEKYDYSMLWNRLMVIASEDVGPANPQLPVILETLRTHYEDAVRRRNDSYRVFLANAILQLARSPKSRVVDHFLWKTYGELEFEGKKLEVPWYAKDPHTGEGDKEKWLSVGAKLENEADTHNPYQQDAEWLYKQHDKLPKKFPKRREWRNDKCKEIKLRGDEIRKVNIKLQLPPDEEPTNQERTEQTSTAQSSPVQNPSEQSVANKHNEARQLERRLSSGKMTKADEEELKRRARNLGKGKT